MIIGSVKKNYNIARLFAFWSQREYQLSFNLGPFITKKEEQMSQNPVAITVQDNQRFKVTITAGVDEYGDSTSLAGPITFSVSDPGALIVSADPTNVEAFWIEPTQSVGYTGTFRVTFTDGVGTLEIDVTVTSSVEVGLVASVDAPILIAVSTPPVTAPVTAPVTPPVTA